LKEDEVFGFAWMGDSATIHKMPLMNILALNGTTAPMTILIHIIRRREGRRMGDTLPNFLRGKFWRTIPSCSALM
jgi:hypothetical protein